MTERRVSHYLLERLVGSGGMGEVYLARDLALGRMAALKVLPAGFDAALRARLLEEARLSARLQHPSIATFYESGVHDGVAFIAMEFVPGETLRSRLRGGALPANEALGAIASVLEGLVHAHAMGVLHRDIKPENVMITPAGLGRLLDFGIGKQTADGPSGVAGDDTVLTELGVLMGTPGYLAPEQVKGAPADARSDVFSLGAVLFEAISGRRAFDGATAPERIANVLMADVPRLEPGGAPPGIDALLERALARTPADRFGSASEFLDALQAVASVGRVSTTPDTVAVVDLENASGNPDDAWIGSAVAEQLTGDLARVPGLQVIARERVLRSQSPSRTDALERARILGCRWLLSGSFQRMGPAVRLSTRLTEVPTARVVASERLDGTLEEIFALQDRLAEAVVRGFPLELTASLKRSAHAPKVAAYELYATGKRLFHRLQKGTFADAMRLFERAIEADPRFALPHGGLAAIHAMHFTYMTDPRDLQLAEAYARRAIELDAGLGEPHIWLAYACWRLGRVDEAVAEAECAQRLAPDSAYGPYFAACAHWSVEREAEALSHFQRAVLVDRQHGFAWLGLGVLLAHMRRFEEGAWCVTQAIALEGTPGPAPTAGAGVFLGEVYRREGRLEDARRVSLDGIAAAERSDHMYRDTFRVIGLVGLGAVALEQGDAEGARAALTQAMAHLKGRPRMLAGRYLLARALAGLATVGRDGAALEEGVRTLESGEAYDASWIWCGTFRDAAEALRRAATTLGRDDVVAALRTQ